MVGDLKGSEFTTKASIIASGNHKHFTTLLCLDVFFRGDAMCLLLFPREL
jgi:hypothetical protein